MQIILTTSSERLDITERVARWDFSHRAGVGYATASIKISGPERDLWPLLDEGQGCSVSFRMGGNELWAGTLSSPELTGQGRQIGDLMLQFEGQGQKLRDTEVWRVYADSGYGRWAPAEELPEGFVADNNNRVYAAGGGNNTFAAGDEATVDYPDSKTVLGADIVQIEAVATVDFGYGAWRAELRTSGGTILWSATAATEESLDLTVDEATGLVFALRATADFAATPDAPVVERADAGAGNLSNGSYRYWVTLVDGNGESPASNQARITINDHTSDGQVSLSDIPTGHAGTTARRIYRSQADGDSMYLLATISDNTTTSYTDNTADAGLGDLMPETDRESSARLTSVVVRTIADTRTSDVVQELLDSEGLEADVSEGLAIDSAVYQGDSRLAVAQDMAALGDGTTPWLFVVYQRAAFSAWPSTPQWELKRAEMGQWSVAYRRDAVWNAVRARLPNGWLSEWMTDADSIARWGRREKTIEVPDGSQTDAERWAAVYLADRAWPISALTLSAQARIRAEDGSLWPAWYVQAGEVVRLRDVLPLRDLTIEVAEVRASPAGVRIVPSGASDRLEVMLARREGRRQAAQAEARAADQEQQEAAQRQQAAIERLTFASAASSSSGGGDGGGSGDMLKTVYDTDDDGQVEAADDADALGGVAAADYMTEAEHTAVGDASPHHARYEDAEAVNAMGAKADGNPLNHDRYTDGEAEAVADTQIATHAGDADAHHDAFVSADIDTLAELNSIVGDATLADEADLVPITRIISATAPLTVAPADGVLDEDLTISLDLIGVPIRMDDHGLTMGLGFEMSRGRLLGYNEETT